MKHYLLLKGPIQKPAVFFFFLKAHTVAISFKYGVAQ